MPAGVVDLFVKNWKQRASCKIARCVPKRINPLKSGKSLSERVSMKDFCVASKRAERRFYPMFTTEAKKNLKYLVLSRIS